MRTKGNLKSKKLSDKIVLLTSAMLFLVFLVLITVSSALTSKGLKESSFNSLEQLSDFNGNTIRQIVNEANKISANITAYLGDSAKNREALDASIIPVNGKKPEETLYKSSLFPQAKFTAYGIQTENYLCSTVRNAVLQSENIVGTAVMYEPYIMSKDIESYSIYCAEDGVLIPDGTYSDYSHSTHYKEAFSKQKTVLTNPYKDNDKIIVTVAAPVIIGKNVIAVVAIDIDVACFKQIDSEDLTYPSMYAAIIKNDGNIIYESTGLNYINTSTFDYMSSSADIELTKAGMARSAFFYTNTINSENDKTYKFYSPVTVGDTTWYAMTAVSVADVNRAAVTSSVILAALCIASLVIILLILYVILKRQLAPISKIVYVANRLSEGDLSVDIEINSNDEIGELSKAFKSTISSLRTMVIAISEILDLIAAKNLSLDIYTEFKGDFSTIENSMRRIVVDLNTVISSISLSAEQVSSGSEQVSEGAQALSQGATEQASSIEELAATISEISEQIQSNAANAKEAKLQAGQVGVKVEESNSQMQSMISAMDEINISSDKINKIIKNIEDIAFQTNILALNAAVEAARAGAAGKGFAVVADEVRSLAGKSQQAAKETTELIKDSISSVKKGAVIAGKTAQSLAEVVEGTKSVSDIVSRISKSSSEQAVSVAQVTLGIDQISGVVQTNSATAEQSAAASEELSAQASMLKQLMGGFLLAKGSTDSALNK
ncbi:MAG: methyl-accepting chemotaxis protein [Hydrogenoanaerobacterium sp.]